jgi:uncharacterized protein DUF4105
MRTPSYGHSVLAVAMVSVAVLFAVAPAPLNTIHPRIPVAAPAQADLAMGAGTTQSTEPGSELRVWLVTAAPGDAVWERFGHNAIRVLNTETGRDASYNWGIFDFAQPGFVPRFLKGEMLYMMAPYQTAPMIESYATTGREVIMQELAMTPAQKLRLQNLADTNALPENREYFYDYFRDNCSTRVRDMLDDVLGGGLYDQLGTRDNGVSYRTHTRRLTQIDPVVFTGMDVLLGSLGDVPISLWEEMFIPMVLRDAMRDATTTDADGNVIPLVLSEEVVVPSTRTPEPARADSWFLRLLLLGVATGSVLGWLGASAAGGSKGAAALFGAISVTWSALAGLFGLVLVLVLFTDHWSMRWNESLFLLSPLSLGLVALVPMALMGRARAKAVLVAKAVLGVALFGLVLQALPATPQSTWMLFAFFLPIHTGVVFGLDRLSKAAGQGRAPGQAQGQA